MSELLLLESDQAATGRNQRHVRLPGSGGGSGGASREPHLELVKPRHSSHHRPQREGDGGDDDGDLISRQSAGGGGDHDGGGRQGRRGDGRGGGRGSGWQGTGVRNRDPIRAGWYRVPGRAEGRYGTPRIGHQRRIGGGAGARLVAGQAKKHTKILIKIPPQWINND